MNLNDKILKPKNGKFYKVLPLEDGLIVLQSICMDGESTLYKLDYNFKIIWQTKPRPDYLRFLDFYYDKNGILKTWDGSGTATLNPDTGELTDILLTK